jgi:hypothetical protein
MNSLGPCEKQCLSSSPRSTHSPSYLSPFNEYPRSRAHRHESRCRSPASHPIFYEHLHFACVYNRLSLCAGYAHRHLYIRRGTLRIAVVPDNHYQDAFLMRLCSNTFNAVQLSDAINRPRPGVSTAFIISHFLNCETRGLAKRLYAFETVPPPAICALSHFLHPFSRTRFTQIMMFRTRLLDVQRAFILKSRAFDVCAAQFERLKF